MKGNEEQYEDEEEPEEEPTYVLYSQRVDIANDAPSFGSEKEAFAFRENVERTTGNEYVVVQLNPNEFRVGELSCGLTGRALIPLALGDNPKYYAFHDQAARMLKAWSPYAQVFVKSARPEEFGVRSEDCLWDVLPGKG